MTEGNTTNLIVNYLPQTLTDDEFRSIFMSIGPLRATKIVRDRTTSYSYGFGFVDFANEEDAAKAIEKLNGMQIQNKKIKVAYSRNHDEAKGANLYVRNLPRAMTQDQLKEVFSEHGLVVNCRILCDQFTGQSKGVGFVLFDRKSQAEAAIAAWHNKVPPGGTEVDSPMLVEPATQALNVKHAEENVGRARPPHQNFMMGNGRGGPMRGPPQNNRFNPMTQQNANSNYMTGAYGGSNAPGGGYTLFVYNIGTDADERSLWQLFSPFGLIDKVNCIRDYENDCCKGYGFVTFINYHEAANAVQALNGCKYKHQPLQVSFKTPKY